VKEARLSQKEIFSHVFYDPMACYMENLCNQNLQLMMGCNLRSKDNDKKTSELDIGCSLLEVSFQSTLFFDSKGCYFQQSQQIFQPLKGHQQGKLPENKDAVEEMIYTYHFMHVLEDPFAVFLEMINNTIIFEILRFRSKCNFSNELLINKIWSKHMQIKQAVDKMMAWMH
jgi:hypothetical protein